MEAFGNEEPGVVGVRGSGSANGERDGELDGVRVCGSCDSLAQVTETPLGRNERVVSQTNTVDDVEEGAVAPHAVIAQIVSSQLQVRNRRVRSRDRVYAVDPGERMYNTILYQAVMNK